MNVSPDTLQLLDRDGELALYRTPLAAGSSQGRTSVLVRTLRSAAARPETVRLLEHEHALRAELDPSWALRPLSLAQHEGRPALLLEDPGAEPLSRLVGAPMEPGMALRIAAGIAAAVAQLHQRGIIHKDLKPSHVLVDVATGRAWLTGFGISSHVPRARQAPEPAEFIAGTLPYMAPEQTGRMNRSVDSRSDLYALGVLLYQMLTGALPFAASDPMEWVHCHIARQPVPPAERAQGIPEPVSAVVMKLLAKPAEERYQTARGVESDLRRCLADWEREGRVASFPLGHGDWPDQLILPERLYGRARAIGSLLAAFERVVETGLPELVLVAGYSGVGKSSVVQELHGALVPHRALYASGKFDRHKQNIPYSTLAQAFQSLVRGLLARPDAELARWRDALREALGANGRLVVDLVPELKLIVGEQPPTVDLPAQDAERRFQLVLRRTIAVFAQREHPLALFLDDLQWLDAATLDLLEDLLTRADLRHLLLIGAFRENEVDAAHPLARRLEAIRRAGARVEQITIEPLAREDVTRLIADALHSGPEEVAPLARVVYDRTAGNPYFARQFLAALAEEGLLAFSHAHPRWEWDLPRILAKGYTDNVADLMVEKLTRLAPATREVLERLACVGTAADVDTLATMLERSTERVDQDAWPAVRAGLIEVQHGRYRFAHDRVQEAAYSLIPEVSLPEAHLRIGRLLAAATPPEKREERVFEIVNQLNRGAALITSPAEREEVAELNLLAARRAKAAAAHASALAHAVTGMELLPDDRWERRPELAFALKLLRGECEFLTGALVEAEERLVALSARARDLVERSSVACLRVDLYTHAGAADRAVAVGLEYLRQAGLEWSEHPSDEEVCRAYSRVWSQLGSRAVEELFDLPLMTDPASLATMDVLTRIVPTSSFLDANLSDLAACTAANLSIERGNSDGSCPQYQWFGLLAGARFGEYRQGARFGQLGYDLAERRGLCRFHARTVVIFGSFVAPWTRHIRDCTELIRRGFELANRTGDLTFAAFGCANVNTNLIAAGAPLEEVQREAEQGLAFAQKMRFGFVVDLINAQLGLVRTLRGATLRFGSFDDGSFDELANERHLSSSPDLALAESWYWVRKLEARFFAGDILAALDAGSRVDTVLWAANLHFERAEYHFFAALCRSLAADGAEGSRREEHLAELRAHLGRLETWAGHFPENFEDRAALVAAELARTEGREPEAERLYERAIRSAGERGFVHHEALAYELASGFYRARGFEKFAELYVRNARQCYLRWGALGKVRQLDRLHPELAEAARSPTPTETIEAPIEHLDLATVIKVSQAISGEIVLERLMNTLMRTALEHAGAGRGVLVLLERGELWIEADAVTKGEALHVELARVPVSAAAVPESVLHYVVRTQENVLLDDAATQNPFSADPYLRGSGARSVLCLPLIHRATLVGALYLENRLARRAFAPARVAVLRVLASAAASSLENGRLYREVQEREAKVRRMVDANVVGVFVGDIERNTILEANHTFLEMLGCTREDLTSGRLMALMNGLPEWSEATRRAFAQIRASGSCEVFEKEYARADGSRIPVLITAASLDDARRECVVFVLDLTERRRAEQERERLRRAEADLAYMSRQTTMGEFAAALAHEVRQPITAASTNAMACIRWLRREPPALAEARATAGTIVDNMSRASAILERVRSLYRRDAPQRTPVDLNELIREMTLLLGERARAQGIAIGTDLDGGLAAVPGDRVQLQQVLMNLMLNGLEAMGPTGGELVVTSSQTDDGGARLSVRDSGVGLPLEQADRIFDAFFTTKVQGTGMGLSISKTIIEAHGGRLWASANPGAGTTFQFTLPGSEDEPSAAVPPG